MSSAAGGPLALYIEVHQSAPLGHIDVATVGIGQAEARAIKSAYERVRDRVLASHPGVDGKVELRIEPADTVEIGAWATKQDGVLRQANSGLHFELPAYRLLQKDRIKRLYSEILADLIAQVAAPRRGKALSQ